MAALALLFAGALGVAPQKSVGAGKAELLGVFRALQTQTRSCGDLEGQGRSAGTAAFVQSPAVCGEQAGLSAFPGDTQLPRPSLSPGSTGIAAGSWRGKGLKSFPFTLRKCARNTWKRKGCQECCWEQDSCLFFVLSQSTTYLNIDMFSC